MNKIITKNGIYSCLNKFSQVDLKCTLRKWYSVWGGLSEKNMYVARELILAV